MVEANSPGNSEPLTCNVSLGTQRAEYLTSVDVFVWDEVAMSNSEHIDAVDKLLKDLTNNNRQTMGGKVFVFCGDFA